MCEQTDIKEVLDGIEQQEEDKHQQALDQAVSSVVAALSERTIRNLLEVVVGQTLADQGDVSDLAMFNTVCKELETRPMFGYKVDEVFVRAVCAASAALCGLSMFNRDLVVATNLAQHTVLRREFSGTIQ